MGCRACCDQGLAHTVADQVTAPTCLLWCMDICLRSLLAERIHFLRDSSSEHLWGPVCKHALVAVL